MKLRQVPARHGALWMRQGFAVLFRNPVLFTMLFAGFMFVSSIMGFAFSWVGNLAVLWAMPLVTLAFMAATRHAVRSEPATPAAALAFLRTPSPSRKALVRLGLAYVSCVALASLVCLVLYGGVYEKLLALMANKNPTKAEVEAFAQSPGLLMSLALPMALMGLVSAVFWHAPALAHWGGQTTVRSLFFSWMACWRNKLAFLVYGLSWMGVMMLFTIGSSIVLGLLGAQALLAWATAAAVMMFSTAFYASLYPTYADCFAEDGDGGEPAPPAALPGPTGL